MNFNLKLPPKPCRLYGSLFFPTERRSGWSFRSSIAWQSSKVVRITSKSVRKREKQDPWWLSCEVELVTKTNTKNVQPTHKFSFGNEAIFVPIRMSQSLLGKKTKLEWAKKGVKDVRMLLSVYISASNAKNKTKRSIIPW